MDKPTATGATVTFTPVYQDRYLFVQRHANDDVLPGHWCFPGGKVEIGETLSNTIIRECLEETGLNPAGQAFFVDSYLLGKRFGVHFAVVVTSDQVKLGPDLQASRWVRSVSDLANFSPRIPGIDTHLYYTLSHLNRFKHQPDLAWTPLEQYDLVEHRFLNR
jgi:8-oxo-dGTP pyrophosphatase MutT (NUDIX family)